MSYLDVWIGDLDDPEFSWTPTDEQWQKTNTPRAVTTSFPAGHKAFMIVTHRIQSGRYEGCQVDWGAWVAKVRKADVLALVDELFGQDMRWWQPPGGPDPYRAQGLQYEAFQTLLRQIQALDDQKSYGLVVTEL